MGDSRRNEIGVDIARAEAAKGDWQEAIKVANRITCPASLYEIMPTVFGKISGTSEVCGKAVEEASKSATSCPFPCI